MVLEGRIIFHQKAIDEDKSKFLVYLLLHAVSNYFKYFKYKIYQWLMRDLIVLADFRYFRNEHQRLICLKPF